jgi:hypothetical protein
LARDRTETRNLAAEHPEKLEELAKIWRDLDVQYAAQGAQGKPSRKRGRKSEE